MVEPEGRLLITGGLGYVGGRTALYLRDHFPRLPIRLTTRRAGPLPEWAADFEVVQADVRDASSLQRAVDGVATVLHLAASNEIESGKDPALALAVTAGGTLEVLRAAVEAGVGRFVYLSTFHVYGTPTAEPITEETVPRPTHPYAITHHAAERFVAMYQARGALETLTLRLSNSYGAPAHADVDRWSLVFNDLCRQAAERGSLTLSSSGKPQRDFVSLVDVGRSVAHFLEMPSGAWGDGLFNLGGECSMSVLDVATRIARVYEERYAHALPIATGSGDSPDSWGPVRFAIDKLKATGIAPHHNLDEEITRTLALCSHQ